MKKQSEPKIKYHRRCVVRNTLSDLELDVVMLARQGWEMDEVQDDTTIAAALDRYFTSQNGMGSSMMLPIKVNMRRDVRLGAPDA